MRKRHRDHEGGRGFVQARQNRAGQNTVIFTHTADQFRQDHPINHAMRVVRNHDNGAFFGDIRQLFIRRGQVDAHHIKSTLPEPLPTVIAVLTLKAAHHAQDGDFAREPLNHADRCGGPRIVKRVRIGQRATVIDLDGIVVRCDFDLRGLIQQASVPTQIPRPIGP